MWIFGGSDDFGKVYNDLWSLDLETYSWTLLFGNATPGATAAAYPSVYNGSVREFSANSFPGARRWGAAWLDDISGLLWLHGGSGSDKNGNSVTLGDTWAYSINLGLWAWMGGSQDGGCLPTYGLQGVENSTNFIGCRSFVQAEFDPTTNSSLLYGGNGPTPLCALFSLYLFGHQLPRLIFYSSTASGEVLLSELWRYNQKTFSWTWLGGNSSQTDQPIFASARGVASAGNWPGPLSGAGTWFFPLSRTFWLFAGGGPSGAVNTLWSLSLSTMQWTWQAGAMGIETLANYSPGSSATPGSCSAATVGVFINGTSELAFIFGGSGRTNTTTDSAFRRLLDYALF